MTIFSVEFVKTRALGTFKRGCMLRRASPVPSVASRITEGEMVT